MRYVETCHDYADAEQFGDGDRACRKDLGSPLRAVNGPFQKAISTIRSWSRRDNGANERGPSPRRSGVYPRLCRVQLQMHGRMAQVVRDTGRTNGCLIWNSRGGRDWRLNMSSALYSVFYSVIGFLSTGCMSFEQAEFRHPDIPSNLKPVCEVYQMAKCQCEMIVPR